MLIEITLLAFLVVTAVAICFVRRLLAAVILYAAFSLGLTLIWILLSAPDLAVTEAAVGTGITGALFFVVLKRIQVMEQEHRLEKEQQAHENA